MDSPWGVWKLGEESVGKSSERKECPGHDKDSIPLLLLCEAGQVRKAIQHRSVSPCSNLLPHPAPAACFERFVMKHVDTQAGLR